MSDRPLHVSFICSGNICRSPYAEGLLRRLAEERGWANSLQVTSAGTLGIEDAPAGSTTLALSVERGVNLLAHRSRGIDDEYLASCDLVLCMGVAHAETLREVCPDYADRIFLLGSYPDSDLDGEEIPDPVGCEESTFREVHEKIECALRPVVRALAQRFSGNG